tara:strand:+ start:747 stop:1019 length:273 start_codon:yes stop_codon:yes gene_type:complete
LHHGFDCPVQAIQIPALVIALLLPSHFFTGVCRLFCHGIALIGTALFSVIGRRIGDWLLVMIWGLDLGCLALAKNAIEDKTNAIEEPCHV